MMDDRNPKEDKKTIEALHSLSAVPERDAAQMARGKAAFLSQAKEIQNQPVSISPFRRLINSFTQPQPRLRPSTLTIAILVSVVLLISFSSSAFAASHALPDDTLYPYKLWLENVRLALTPGSDPKIDLHLAYAEERLQEYQALHLKSTDPLSDEVLDNFYTHTRDVNQLLPYSHEEGEQESRLHELEERLEQLLGEEGEDQEDGPDLEGTAAPEIEDEEGVDLEKAKQTLTPNPTPTVSESGKAEATESGEAHETPEIEDSQNHEETQGPEDTESPESTATPEDTGNTEESGDSEDAENTQTPDETATPDDEENDSD